MQVGRRLTLGAILQTRNFYSVRNDKHEQSFKDVVDQLSLESFQNKIVTKKFYTCINFVKRIQRFLFPKAEEQLKFFFTVLIKTFNRSTCFQIVCVFFRLTLGKVLMVVFLLLMVTFPLMLLST